jgi:DNA polymerase-3 subunit gamma/tau
MGYLVLARKWRPKGFDDLVGQEPITRILKNAISQGKIAHAYLFSVIEIDGASNNSVDDIRDLRERVKYAPSGGRYKVYIIDEVHMLSGSAFNALLKTLEEPPSHVIFVLATTEMRKIPATVLSRCQHMPFRRISSGVIKSRLKVIADSEGISISPAALGLVARAADGSMRDSLTILDQVSAFSAEVTEEGVKGLLGIADFGLLAQIAKALIQGDRVGILETVEDLVEQGTDIRAFSKELTQFFRDLLVASVMRKPEEVLDMSPEEIEAVKGIVAASSEDQLTLMLSEIMKSEAEVRSSSSPRLSFEMALMRTSFLSSLKPIREVIENIGRLAGQSPAAQPMPDALRKAEVEARREPETAKRMAVDEPPVVAATESSLVAGGEDDAGPANILSDKDMDESKEGSDTGDESGKDRNAAGEGEGGIWERTLAQVEHRLASKLAQAKTEILGDELFVTLNGGQAVFEDSIRKELKAIEEILNREAGRGIRIKLTTAHKKSVRKKDLKEKVMDEPLIKEALELFEGRIVDVTPAEGSDTRENGG